MKYLYFSAPWCGPCRMFGPVMERVSTKIPVQKVNVDEDQDLAMRYSVRNVPRFQNYIVYITVLITDICIV